MTNTELSDSKEMGSAYPSQVRTLAACNARLKDEETKVGEEDSAAVRTRVEGGGVKMHEMQDHLCRVSRSRNQGTPHGVEGDPCRHHSTNIWETCSKSQGIAEPPSPHLADKPRGGDR